MIFLRSLLLILLCCSTAAAQDKKLSQDELDKATGEAMHKLQGLWMFEKGERNAAGYWSVPEEGLYFERNVVRHTRKNGDLIFNGDTCTFTIDPTKNPTTIDLIRKNGNVGQKVLGIYKIEGDRLVLATDTTTKDKRPGKFGVKLTFGAERATNVQTFKLVKAEPHEKSVVKKFSPEMLEAANDAVLKSLQGHWIFEKSERNGFSYWTLPEESIYIEKNFLRHAKKNGDLIFNGSAAEITVDASKPYTKITLVRKNGAPGQKVLGIVKVEGNRLVIATNTSGDNSDIHPGQFTVRLSAGLERAAIVQTYKRAPME